MSLSFSSDTSDSILFEKKLGRMVHIRPINSVIQKFLRSIEKITVDDLKLIPYKRFICAHEMLSFFGDDFGDRLVSIVNDYNTGCAVIHFGDFGDLSTNIKIATAVSHLLSKPIPEPSGNYYGITTVVHNNEPAFKILDPYNFFSLHTDGIFSDNPVDWIMMMKIEEENAIGGESRLLHMADFDSFEHIYNLKGNAIKFSFGLDAKDRRYDIFSKVSNMEKAYSNILKKTEDRRQIKFVDQFILTESINEAKFINNVQMALESCEAIISEPLPVGSMLILNNSFWVHGRAPFERNLNLRRSLLRQYGYFS
jgi:protein CsiD